MGVKNGHVVMEIATLRRRCPPSVPMSCLLIDFARLFMAYAKIVELVVVEH